MASQQSLFNHGRISKRDPLLDNEAVRIHHETARVRMNPLQRKEVSDKVTRFDIWKLIVTHWILAGWKPLNIAGMLSAYQDYISGKIPKWLKTQEPRTEREIIDAECEAEFGDYWRNSDEMTRAGLRKAKREEKRVTR